jgi:chromatin remodeling complex protein RSC6
MQWKLSTSRQSVRSKFSAMPRGDLTKKLWNYIKKNKLQVDEKKRTLINADDALKVVFGGKKQVSMFEMTKLVSGHVK